MITLQSHRAKAIKMLLDQANVRYIYLPPYSPDLNPIEQIWSDGSVLMVMCFKCRCVGIGRRPRLKILFVHSQAFL